MFAIDFPSSPFGYYNLGDTLYPFSVFVQYIAEM